MNEGDTLPNNIRAVEAHISQCALCQEQLQQQIIQERLNALGMGDKPIDEDDVHRFVMLGLGPSADKFNFDPHGLQWLNPEHQKNWDQMLTDDRPRTGTN
jgi:hypothetical protein